MIYLDNSATTRTLPEAAEAARSMMCDTFFNPASAYRPSVQVERQMEQARGTLARAIGCQPDEILFTSGGTESNNMAICGTLKAQRGSGLVITTKVEHPSVYEVFRSLEQSGRQVVYLDVDKTGAVRLDQLDSVLCENTAFVSIMQVNNETGAINDVDAAYALIKRRAPMAVVHTDGVQGFCKQPFYKPHGDLYSISGHKFHAPKGVGALYVRKGTRFAGGQTGGGQERNLRSGTSNTPGIMGMQAALQNYMQNQPAFIAHMYECKKRLAQHLLSMPDVVCNGPDIMSGAPHILNASFLGVRGEVLLHALEQKEIYVSTGSACSAHKAGKNRILTAMGIVGERQEGAIRFSFCPYNTLEEMDVAAQAVWDQIQLLRRFKRR